MSIESPAQSSPPSTPIAETSSTYPVLVCLGVMDKETVEQMRKNPYLQFLLGLSEYSDRPLFEASMMTHFQQRLSLEVVNPVNAAVVQTVVLDDETPKESLDADGGVSVTEIVVVVPIEHLRTNFWAFRWSL